MTEPRRHMLDAERKGILFIATGKKFRNQALESAQQIKNLMSIPIAIVSEDSVPSSHVDQWVIVNRPSYSFRDKPRYIVESPFQETLYLDADIVLCKPIAEVFSLLQYFDIAASHAPLRQSPLDFDPDICASTFPELNTGVVLFEKNRENMSLMDMWLHYYDEYIKIADQYQYDRYFSDQPAFRQAVMRSKARLATLPPEYNFRTIVPQYVHDTVKILHGKTGSEAEIARCINLSVGPRVYSRNGLTGRIVVKRWHSIAREGRVKTAFIMMKEYGFKYTVRRMVLSTFRLIGNLNN